MPELFRTAAALDIETEALVIHCSAARFQPQMRAFLADGLRLRDYSLIAIPGGVQVLTLLDYLPKFSWAGWHWVKFLADIDRPPRIVLVGHQDCRWYRDPRFWSRRRASTRDRIVGDLKEVASQASERFPGARVETYYAAVAGREIVFEAV